MIQRHLQRFERLESLRFPGAGFTSLFCSPMPRKSPSPYPLPPERKFFFPLLSGVAPPFPGRSASFSLSWGRGQGEGLFFKSVSWLKSKKLILKSYPQILWKTQKRSGARNGFSKGSLFRAPLDLRACGRETLSAFPLKAADRVSDPKRWAGSSPFPSVPQLLDVKGILQIPLISV